MQLGTYLQKNKGFKSSALIALTVILCGGAFCLIQIWLLELIFIYFGQTNFSFCGEGAAHSLSTASSFPNSSN